MAQPHAVLSTGLPNCQTGMCSTRQSQRLHILPTCFAHSANCATQVHQKDFWL